MASQQAFSVPSATPGPSLYTIPQSGVFASLTSATSVNFVGTVLAILAALLILEQAIYRQKKQQLPGDSWTIPLIGKFADSLKPTMEGYQRQWDSGALSALSVFNIFIVMASSNEYARKILNSPNHAEPCIVHSAKQILQPDNWVFLTGKAHVDFRRVLNVLFTRRALETYFDIMDSCSRKHFDLWLADAKKDPSAKPIMMTARTLNMDVSLKVFCGEHIPEEGGAEINDKYWLITQALELVNFPLAVPGTKVYKAVQASKIAFKWLALASARSKAKIAKGGEVTCMLDEWNRVMAEPTYKGRSDFTDDEIAKVVFSFLFASQDAMTSGLIYGFQHMVDHPDVLAKIREEQYRVREGDVDKAMTLEMLDRMPYLKAFVKESLRLKPPVTMIPYKTLKPFPISPDYTVPVGSMVIPSFYNSLHDPNIYPEPTVLNPERWLDPDSLANANPKSYIGFGAGPHKCIGIEYANMNIAIVLANAAVLMNMEHELTPLSDKVQIIATLFPQDGCLLKLSHRPKP